MPDQLFNHDIFSIQGIKQATSSGIASFLQDALFDEFNNMLLRHVSEEDPGNPAGYIPSKNFIASLAQLAASPADNDLPLPSEMTTGDLINGLKFLPGTLAFGRDEVEWPATVNRTTAVLNELASRGRESQAQADFIKGLFKEKRQADDEFRSDINAPIISAPSVASNGLGQAIRKSPSARKRLSSEATKSIRANLPTTTDGQRVSTEYHEYRYNIIESDQWQGMLDRLRQFAPNQTDDISTNAADYTYGNYVDMKLGRKLVERLRKVERRAGRANVLLTLNDQGIDKETFINNLLAQVDAAVWSDVIAEIEGVFNI